MAPHAVTPPGINYRENRHGIMVNVTMKVDFFKTVKLPPTVEGLLILAYVLMYAPFAYVVDYVKGLAGKLKIRGGKNWQPP